MKSIPSNEVKGVLKIIPIHNSLGKAALIKTENW